MDKPSTRALKSDCSGGGIPRRGEEAWDSIAQPKAEQHARRAAERGDDKALGEHLPRDAPVTGAKRKPQADLALTSRRPRQQQVGEVRRGDEQHETDKGDQHQQWLAELIAKVIDSAAAVGESKPRARFARRGAQQRPDGVAQHDVERGLCLPLIRTGCEAAHGQNPPVVRVVEQRRALAIPPGQHDRLHAQRQEDVRLPARREPRERRGVHADDEHRQLIDLNRPADDGPIAAKAPWPRTSR